MNKLQQRFLRLGIALAVFAVQSAFLLTRASAATAATMTFTATADAYVSASTPSTDYGAGTSLRVDGSPDVHSYVRFVVSGLSGQRITNASLKIYATSGSSAGLTAMTVANNTWGENNTTYNNMPPMGKSLGTSPAVIMDSWTSVDVTLYITAEGTYSFGVITPGSTGISLSARESGAHAPKLVLTLGTVSPTATATLAATQAKAPTPTLLVNTATGIPPSDTPIGILASQMPTGIAPTNTSTGISPTEAPALMLLPDSPTPTFTQMRATPGAGETTRYVNGTSGSDNNPGTQSRPWKTIQKAANTLTAGQTVSVAGGTYAERVSVTKSGADGALIGFQAAGKVVMLGFQVQANYISISGFEITDRSPAANGWGIYLIGSHDMIQGNSIHDLAWGGILLFANTTSPSLTSNTTVQNNTIYHVGQVGIDVRGRNNIVQYNDISAIMQIVPWIASPPSWADADGIHFHGQGHILRGNRIHDILYSQPENVTAHIDCFQTFASEPSQEAASNVILDGNLCYEPTSNSTLGVSAKLVQVESAQGLTFVNNVVYAYLLGIVKNSTGVSFVNNTFSAPLTASSGQGIQLINAVNTTIQNNIFSNQTNGIGAILFDAVSNSSLTSGHNCLWKQGSNDSSPGDVVGQDPRFVNPQGDFHLQAGSPCINRGLGVNVTSDYDGKARPQGAGFDMGAYEAAQ